MMEGSGGNGRLRGRLQMFVLVVLLLAAGASAGYWFAARSVGAGAAAQTQPGPVFSVGSIMTNLGAPGRPVYIKVAVDLEVDGAKALAELDERAGAVRDRIIRVLRGKLPADLEGPDGMRALAAEIRDVVNQMLTSGAVREVYFPEFIIQ